MKLSLADAKSRYGDIVNGTWANEGNWCSLVSIPEDIALQWVKSATGNPTRKIYCNNDMAAPLLAALDNLKTRGFIKELKTFDGCFMIRDVRGVPGMLSTHAYALAIDLNASTNKLGEMPTLSEGFVKCFADAGFVWGGNFHRKDGMHFQYALW